MKVILFEDTNIETYYEVVNAYKWCVEHMGPPDGERWSYGKNVDTFGRTIINSPMEIEYLIFNNEEDAIIFKLRW